MSRPLDPDELRALLDEATQPIRPGPEAYERIKDGIRRDSPWRFRLATAGVLAAAAVGGAVFASVPHQHSSTADLTASGLVPTASGTTVRPSAGGGTGAGSGQGGSVSRAPGSGTGPGSGTRPSAGPTGPSAVGGGAATPAPRPTSSAQTAEPTVPSGPGATGDLDGDGRPDKVVAAPGSLTVTLTKVPRTETVPVPAADGQKPAATVVDLDHDSADEVFVRVDAADPTSTYQVAQLVAGQLTLVPTKLLAGADATHGDGFSCTAAGDIVQVSADSTDGGNTYSGTATTYDLEGAVLVPVGSPAPYSVDLSKPDAGTPFTAGCGAPAS